MASRKHTASGILIPCILVAMTISVWASRAPTKPLAERVRDAETIFVGVATNKVVDGGWVRADLVIETPLLNAECSKTVAVIWRATLGGRSIYDTGAGSRGIAILKDKHQALLAIWKAAWTFALSNAGWDTRQS